jgi:hypothetical protein
MKETRLVTGYFGYEGRVRKIVDEVLSDGVRSQIDERVYIPLAKIMWEMVDMTNNRMDEQILEDQERARNAL